MNFYNIKMAWVPLQIFDSVSKRISEIWKNNFRKISRVSHPETLALNWPEFGVLMDTYLKFNWW